MSANTALDHFLGGLQLTQYADMLKKQNVDLDVLECMDADDLRNFGVENADHIMTILAAIADGAYCELCRTEAARNDPPPADGDTARQVMTTDDPGSDD